MTATETQIWPLSRLTPYVRNPRKNDEAVERMVASIREFGFKIPVLARSSGEIVDGHLRVKAARKLELAEVPVILCDEWTDAQVKAFRLLVNRSVNWAEWDDELVALEMVDLQKLEYDLSLTGFDAPEVKEFLATQAVYNEAAQDEVPEPPVTPVSQTGDVWLLGDHRLRCGDSTREDHLDDLTRGDRADFVFTDPPYGVAVASRIGTTGVSSAEARAQGKAGIENDAMSLSDLTEFLRRAFANMLRSTRPGACWYVAAPHGPMGLAFSITLNEIGVWRHSLVWIKDSLVMGRMDYHYRHEPIYYGWTPGGTHMAVPTRDQDTVWNCPRPKRSEEHPTMKPVELVERAVVNSSKAGDVVLDLFGGSGSTLIAAEKNGRRALLMELDPKYVDVIVKRWQEFAGKKATLDSTGKTFDEVAAARLGVTAAVPHEEPGVEVART